MVERELTHSGRRQIVKDALHEAGIALSCEWPIQVLASMLYDFVGGTVWTRRNTDGHVVIVAAAEPRAMDKDDTQILRLKMIAGLEKLVAPRAEDPRIRKVFCDKDSGQSVQEITLVPSLAELCP